MGVLTSNFPTGIDTSATLGEVSNRAKTTLSTVLAATGETAIVLADASLFPPTGVLTIDNELITYSAKSTNTLTIETRGTQGSTAAAHSVGALVYLRFTKGHYEVLRSAVIFTETKLGNTASTPTAGTYLKGTGVGTSAWGVLTAIGSNTQIQYNNAGAMAGATQLFWNEASKSLGISIAPAYPFHIRDYNVTEFYYQYGSIYAKRTGPNFYDSPVVEFYRAGGTVAAPTAAAVGDFIGDFNFRIHNGTDYYLLASFGAVAENAGLGGQLVFRTQNAATTSIPPDRLFITGNGNIVIGTAALATTATDGFLYLASSAGIPTGTPTTYTGRIPLIVDTTNSKLMGYIGGVWANLSGSAGGGSPAGATGQIQFNNAGAFGTDTNFKWDITNKRLGIGTASPTADLEVTSTAVARIALISGSTFMSFGADQTDGPFYMWNQADSEPLRFATAGSITGAGFSEKMRLTSAGSLVIGTSALATNATDGFLYLASSAGEPTGTPTAFTGRIPLIVDTTNSKLMGYIGGVWASLTGAGGTGSPAGATGQIQFNNAGAFGADSDLTWDAANNDLMLGGVDASLTMLGITTEPPTPAAGSLTQYVKSYAGRVVQKVKGASGIDYPLQAAFWTNNITMWSPTTATAGVWLGTAGAGAGTYSSGLPTATNVYTSIKRGRWANVATTLNQVLGQRNTEAMYMRGSVANQGGFFFYARCGFDVWTVGSRFFAGMHTGTTVISVDPSALNNTVGFAVDSADNGAISFLTRGTVATKAATGFTVVSNKGYDLYIFAKPNGTDIGWRIVDINTGTEASGTATLNLPLNTTLLTAGVLASNAAIVTVTATQLGINRIYVETDF